MSQDRFREILLGAIEEGLSSLGNSSKDSIFYHLETSFHLKKEDIPTNLTEFKNALDRIFGPGAPYLEKIITKTLYEKLGLDFPETESVDLLASANDVKKQVTLGRR